jgi:hypothetical protein
MKKYYLVLVFISIGFFAQSQVLISLLLGDKLNSDKLKFGLEGGLNWTNISGMETDSYTHYFNMGFYFDFLLKNQWHFYTGTLVKSNLGVAKLTPGDLNSLAATTFPEYKGKYNQVTNTFLVPAFIKYDFKNYFYLEAGPQFGLLSKAYVEFNADEEGIEARTREKNTDLFNRIDAGIGAGLGYTFFKGEGMTLGFKYYHGFVDVYKDIPGTKNNSFNLKVNIRIGANNKEQTEK